MKKILYINNNHESFITGKNLSGSSLHRKADICLIHYCKRKHFEHEVCIVGGVPPVIVLHHGQGVQAAAQHTVVGEVKWHTKQNFSSKSGFAMENGMIINRNGNKRVEVVAVNNTLCSSPRCKMCTGNCSKCNKCIRCMRVCKGDFSGVCSRCSICSGGARRCRWRCREEQSDLLCEECVTGCYLEY